jgi:hypothetical protein
MMECWNVGMVECPNPVHPVNPVKNAFGCSAAHLDIGYWTLDIGYSANHFLTTEYPENTEKQPKTALSTTNHPNCPNGSQSCKSC